MISLVRVANGSGLSTRGELAGIIEAREEFCVVLGKLKRHIGLAALSETGKGGKTVSGSRYGATHAVEGMHLRIVDIPRDEQPLEITKKERGTSEKCGHAESCPYRCRKKQITVDCNWLDTWRRREIRASEQRC